MEVLKRTGFVVHSQFTPGSDVVLHELKSQKWPTSQGAEFKLEKDFVDFQITLLNGETSLIKDEKKI